jgi:hypothetical protein
MSLTGPGRATAAGLAATLILAGAGACSSSGQLQERQEPSSAATIVREVQGPGSSPATVISKNGKVITCPSGAEPTVYIEEATFGPLLTGGTRLSRGTYSIALHGRVVNETNSPILIRSIQLAVGSTRWRIRVSHPRRLTSGDSKPITAEGSFRNEHVQQAKVSAHLTWSWRDAGLLPCGAKGLIEDD